MGSKIKIILGVLVILVSSAGLIATGTLIKKPKKETPSLAQTGFFALPQEQILYHYPFEKSPNDRAPFDPAEIRWNYYLSSTDIRTEKPDNFIFNLNYQGKDKVMSIAGNGAITMAFPDNYFGNAYIVKTSFYDSGTTPAGVFLSLTSNEGAFDGNQQGIAVGVWPEKFTDQITYYHTGNINRFTLKNYISREPNKWHTLEIIVTPYGSYAKYDNQNLSTIPNQEGAKALYKNHPHFRRINLGNLFNTQGTYYFDKVEVIAIPELSSPLDISRYFVREAVENPAKFLQQNSLLQAAALAMDQYFNGVDHANEIKTKTTDYANSLSLPFTNARDFNFNVINPHSNDLWWLSAVWGYLEEPIKNQIAQKWIKALDEIVVHTDPAQPFPADNPNFTSEFYSYCPEQEKFPYSSWQGNTSAEEISWAARVLSMGAVLFSNHTRASIWKEYARFYAFHTRSKGESLSQTGNSYLYLPDNLKNWRSRTIFDDGLFDNHDFHPNPQYASGSVNGSYLTAKLYQKLRQPTFPELLHNVNEVYEKSVLPYIDTEYWRWKYDDQVKVKIYEWSMTYGYWSGDWPCNPDSVYPHWCELNSNYPLGSPQARKLGQVGPLKNSSDCLAQPLYGTYRPRYGTSGLSDWGLAPYYFYQIANLLGDSQLEQQSAEFDYYILSDGNNIFDCTNSCSFRQSMLSTAINYLFFLTDYPVTSFQLPYHRCTITTSVSQVDFGNPITVSYSGNPTSDQKVRLLLTGANGQPLTGIKFNGSDPRLTTYDNKSYYLLSEASDASSHSGSLVAPPGKYFLYCDINYNPYPCSGNPFCDYNNSFCSSSGSSVCNSVNCTSLGFTSCSEHDIKTLEVTTSFSPGDFNHNNKVDGDDISFLLSKWKTGDADLNGDGKTDEADLTILLINWRS